MIAWLVIGREGAPHEWWIISTHKSEAAAKKAAHEWDLLGGTNDKLAKVVPCSTNWP